MFYYEQRSFDGRWIPVKAVARPQVSKGYLVAAESRGKAVRNIRPIPPEWRDWPLDRLAEAFEAAQ